MSRTEPAYQQVRVALGDLSGPDGNAFAILGRVAQAMRAAGLPPLAVDQYLGDARTGDYRHLLTVTRRTVTVTDQPIEDEEDTP